MSGRSSATLTLHEMSIGGPATRLVVLRGNSGAGKSSVARELRAQLGRGVALVEQDYLRRIVLRERVSEGTLHIRLIEQVVTVALDGGYDVVLEGIFSTDPYRQMLTALRDAHLGQTSAYYLDVSLEESLARHLTRPQRDEFTPEEMRGWYVADDILGWECESRVPATSTLAETVAAIRSHAFQSA
jgi:predicted kinase